MRRIEVEMKKMLLDVIMEELGDDGKILVLFLLLHIHRM